MSKFETIKNQKPASFLRGVGISLDTFILLLKKITDHIKQENEKYPLKKRGRKSSLCLEDMLLLTLYYLRHYITLDQLGKNFGISESYACKIYHRMANILINVLDLKNRNELMNKNLEVILIDVTEQPIERPKKKQKAYYSGKKNYIQLKSN
ncbi:MAG: helix-turn-helix domain-containing protein [Promethearchaeota archaeon]